MSSLRLKHLVADVLQAMPAGDPGNVIEEVFVAIEGNPVWRKTYDSAAYGLGKGMAAAWTGFWVAHLTKRVGEERQTAARSTLIESFMRLSATAVKRNAKLKEPEAVQAMHTHFLAHRDSLPADVREQRDVIVALIMDGLTPETAFEKALEPPRFAW